MRNLDHQFNSKRRTASKRNLLTASGTWLDDKASSCISINTPERVFLNFTKCSRWPPTARYMP